MNKYRIFLTKNYTVAATLFRAFKSGGDILSVSYGSASSKGDMIPKIYQDAEYFCCVVEYFADADVDPYELIIA